MKKWSIICQFLGHRPWKNKAGDLLCWSCAAKCLCLAVVFALGGCLTDVGPDIRIHNIDCLGAPDSVHVDSLGRGITDKTCGSYPDVKPTPPPKGGG